MEPITDFDLFLLQQDPYLSLFDFLDFSAPLPTDFGLTTEDTMPTDSTDNMLIPPPLPIEFEMTTEDMLPSLSPATSSIASVDLYNAAYYIPASPNSSLDPMITPLDTITDTMNADPMTLSPTFTMMTPLPKQRYYCNECPKSCGRPQDLQRHVTSLHEKTKLFVCRKCNKGFARKDALRRHERNKKNFHKVNEELYD